jgi:alkane 1-monooxygenase
MKISNLRFYVASSMFLVYWLGVYNQIYSAVLFFTFGFLPLLDLILGDELHQPIEPDMDESFKSPIYLWVWLYLNSMFLSLFYVMTYQISLFNLIFMALSFGMVTSQGIAISHELCHKKSCIDRNLSKLILTLSLYNHFYVEHKYGHHVNVATPLDPATARKNQNVYEFIIQSVSGGIRNAWSLEYKQNGIFNYLTYSWFINACLVYMIYLISPIFLVFFLIQAFIGVCFLEIINYIEHYGLQRKMINGKYEPVRNKHSWDTSNVMTNLILFRIGRHSDHHTHPYKEYQNLLKNDDSPKLPYGYPISSLLSLYPNIWFEIMNPILEEYQSRDNKLFKQ